MFCKCVNMERECFHVSVMLISIHLSQLIAFERVFQWWLADVWWGRTDGPRTSENWTWQRWAACLFWLLVSTNTAAEVRMLYKRFWCWFNLDFVEKGVQSVEFRCSWAAGPAAGRSPTTNTNSHSGKMAARNHRSQKYTLQAERGSHSPSFPGRGEVSSTIIGLCRRETEQMRSEKKLPDKCKWGQISSHYCACRPSLAAKTKVCQRDYLGWLQGGWCNGWQQVSKFRGRIHIHHGGWQPSTASWAGNCKKLPRQTSKCIYILLPFMSEAAREVRACY